MNNVLNKSVVSVLFCALFSCSVIAERVYEKQAPPRQLTEEQAVVASGNYQKYCSLCHGENREGYKNDHAPSLKSKQLFEAGIPHSVLRPLSYGRQGTAMAGYLEDVGGPMTLDGSVGSNLLVVLGVWCRASLSYLRIQ